METTPNSIEVLLEKAEQYGKTSLELFKLKLLKKQATPYQSFLFTALLQQ